VINAPTLPPVTPAPIAEGGEVIIQSGWRLGLRSFAENRLAVLGMGILIFFVLFCWVGPMFYHGDVTLSNLGNANSPPVQGLPLGADYEGFDVLGQLMVGGQVSLEIGILAAVIATVVGTLWGAVAGLAGGVVDGLMMRIVDIVLSVPLLFVILIVGSRYGSTVLVLGLIIGGFSWHCASATSSPPREPQAPAGPGWCSGIWCPTR
jgi:peptide/nickel transport system permease protein